VTKFAIEPLTVFGCQQLAFDQKPPEICNRYRHAYTINAVASPNPAFDLPQLDRRSPVPTKRYRGSESITSASRDLVYRTEGWFGKGNVGQAVLAAVPFLSIRRQNTKNECRNPKKIQKTNFKGPKQGDYGVEWHLTYSAVLNFPL